MPRVGGSPLGLVRGTSLRWESAWRGAFLSSRGASLCSRSLASLTEARAERKIGDRRSGALSVPETAQVYAELSKHKLSGLVMMTAGAGFVMAGPPFDPVALVATSAGTFLASACANTLNQVYESPRDARMKRTMRRPLPSGRVSVPHALAFATATGAGGVGILYAAASPLAAALGAANIALYAGVYTPLKVRTSLNTVVGSVVGAIPPLMGWAAATGSLSAPEPLALAATLFLWQMPHFYALAWMYRADYAQGGYKMLPLFDESGGLTSAHSLAYAAGLSLVPPACWAAGICSPMFVVESVLFNGGLVALAVHFYRRRTHGSARKLFLYSLVHLPAMLGLMILHGSRGDPGTADEHGGHTLRRIRELGRSMCVHDRVNAPEACPVVVEETVRTVGQLARLSKKDGTGRRGADE